MPQVLHVFRKDVRRLWWAILAGIVLLAVLAEQDCRRADYVPGSMEGWLNLLLPLAWSYVIALLIQDEPLAGTRQFWITRPYRRPALVGAKALFVVLFIHVPLFVENCFVVAARGFSPLDYLPALFAKQVMIFAAITLPAAALAALVRNLAHFVAIAIAVAAAALYVQGAFGPGQFGRTDGVRNGIAIVLLALAAAAVVLLQYARRKTTISRALGSAAAVAAALIYAYLPRTVTASVLSSLSPAPHASGISLRIDKRPQPAAAAPPGSVRVIFTIPVAITGVDPALDVRAEQLALDLVTPDGTRYPAKPVYPEEFNKMSGPVDARLYNEFQQSGWLYLTMDPPVYERLKTVNLKFAGRAIATILRFQEPVALAPGGTGPAGALGRCGSRVTEDWRQAYLKVSCESPNEMPPMERVEVLREGERSLRTQLGRSSRPTSPASTWLSPVNRRDGLFTLSSVAEQNWMLYRGDLPSARVVFRPEEGLGSVVFQYEFDGVSLDEFMVRPFAPKRVR